MRELEKSDHNSKSLLANVLDLEGDFILAPGGQPLSMTSSLNGLDSKQSPLGPAPCSADPLEKELHEIYLEIRVISDKIRAEAEAGAVENEWKFAAMVLDRVCLLVFTFF